MYHVLLTPSSIFMLAFILFVYPIRFEKRIYIPLPDEESRLQLFKIHMGDEKMGVDTNYIKHVAQITDG